jgi:glycosyltransferase involved in cell wall biosynthesis
MSFKKFNEFINEENQMIIQSFSKEGITEKSMPFPIDSEILKDKVAIYCSTYNIAENSRGRGEYITYDKMLSNLIDSLTAQTYTNWKLFIVGDCFEPEEDLVELLKSKLKPSQYTFHNMSKPGERGTLEGTDLRLSGGCKAKNKAISLAKGEGFNYLAHIDHDDAWKPNHLENVMQAFQQDPDVGFVYTKGAKRRVKGSGLYYWGADESKPVLFYDDIPHKIKEAPHSGIVWHGPTVGWPKYRSVPEQKSTAPKRASGMGGDEDIIRRIVDSLVEKGKKAIYVPKLTVRLRNAQGKMP